VEPHGPILDWRLLAFISGSLSSAVEERRKNSVTANAHEWARIEILWNPMDLFPIGVYWRSLAVHLLWRRGKGGRII